MSDTKFSFWSSLCVFIERPNIINKRVMGSHLLNCWEVCLQSNPFIYELLRNSSLIEIEQNMSDCKKLNDFRVNQMKSTECSILVVRQLLLKQSLKNLKSSELTNSDITEFILLNSFNNEVIFVPKVTDNQIIPNCCYRIFLNTKHEIDIEFLSESVPSIWLSHTVLPKLRQWMAQELEGNQFQGSLQLIGSDQYCLTYNRLKTIYALPLIELWKQNETTDPLKFVFEDIAIAAYLIVLWEQQNRVSKSSKKQSFVDLGCGNGLLVYLLNCEGYDGIGIDLRRRNIWNKYGSDVKLIEKVFTPSDDSLIFAGYDWLIGNHSDELTPWIPYIGANSSKSMNVFLLPCCPFDFNGFKYQRISSNKSQYNCFIKYMIEVCETLGFHTKVDKLRIPSTKRICLVCDSRNYDLNIENAMKAKRKQFVEQKIRDFSDYKPRDKIETVKNCTRVPKDVLNQIVIRIADELLKNNTNLTISCLVNILTPDMLSHLKSQCGGLQTLLRNHKHIFEVKNGFICFSRPKSITETELSQSNQNLKTKQCWFFHKHPNGCPLPSVECRYSH